jgi:radical SAM protein with 4Fe4S-binding SPASM domain
MDVSLFERLIDEVGPYLLTVSLWAWGEPLLHPKLQEILRAVRKYNIATLLSTNGQKLNNEQAVDALVQEPPSYLIVAIDGLTDETNSKFRVGAKLAPILSGVRRIAEIKKRRGLELPVLHMRYIVMKHNQHEVPRLKTFAESNSFDLLTVRTLSIIDSESPDQVHREFVPDMAEWRAYDYRNGTRIQRGDFICQEPFWFPTVFADGTLVACEQDYNAQQSLGMMSSDVSFTDLWFSKRAARVRKMIRDNPHSLSFCRNCPYRDRPTTDVSVGVHFLNPKIHCPSLISRAI